MSMSIDFLTRGGTGLETTAMDTVGDMFYNCGRQYAVGRCEMPNRKAHDLPAAGATFSRTFGGVDYIMTVVRQGRDIGYKVGEKIYESPSAAAKAVTQHAVNGWRFWRIEG